MGKAEERNLRTLRDYLEQMQSCDGVLFRSQQPLNSQRVTVYSVSTLPEDFGDSRALIGVKPGGHGEEVHVLLRQHTGDSVYEDVGT